MYDARTLKPRIHADAHKVECPVLGCTTRVVRQRSVFRRDDEFQCAEHAIYISAGTHEHADYTANLLLADSENVQLLQRLFGQKRESTRLGRERSEDALTFNVFRGIERAGELDAAMSVVAGCAVRGSSASYWALDSVTGRAHALLSEARTTFHEVPDRGTEPDILIESDDTVFLIEAKLASSNSTKPTHLRSVASYERAASGWFASVFSTGGETVAVQEKLYQLMRLWLLGTWMADRAGKKFVLVSLCGARAGENSGERFGKHLVQTDSRRFVCSTWEQLRELCRSKSGEPSLVTLVEYLDHKTLGYDAKGALQLAFADASRSRGPRRSAGTPVRRELTADAGLHVLRNEWTQTRKLREHCEILAAGFSTAVTATIGAVPKRGEIGFQMGTLRDGARKRAMEYSKVSGERSLEQSIFATLGPGGTFVDNPIVGRIIAYQVPLFDRRSRAGWGHIDLLGLTALGQPVVIELKCASSRETPLRCMMEGVANAIAVRENWPAIRRAILGIDRVTREELSVADTVGPVETIVLAPTEYWAAWEPDGQPGYAVDAAARESFRLVCSTSDANGFPVLLAALETSSDGSSSVRRAVSSFSANQ
jgi:hypothetical protein